jgi:calmodulin
MSSEILNLSQSDSKPKTTEKLKQIANRKRAVSNSKADAPELSLAANPDIIITPSRRESIIPDISRKGSVDVSGTVPNSRRGSKLNPFKIAITDDQTQISESVPLEKEGFKLVHRQSVFKYDDFLNSMRRQKNAAVGMATPKDLKEKISRSRFPGLSREELCYYLEAFCAFDIDGNGTINEDEMAQAMISINPNYTPETIRDIIGQIDKDGDGEISIEEFINQMVKIRKKNQFLATKEQILDAMELVDYDHDGLIGVGDLRALFGELGESISHEDAASMIRYASSSNDSYCNKADFYKLMIREDELLK